MSVIIPVDMKSDQLRLSAFFDGAEAERDRCIEIILQCEERGDWTADLIIARLREGLL